MTNVPSLHLTIDLSSSFAAHSSFMNMRTPLSDTFMVRYDLDSCTVYGLPIVQTIIAIANIILQTTVETRFATIIPNKLLYI